MKLFSKPPVGASISVTTRYKESYYYATNKWRDTTYTGVVLPDESWFKPDQFKMTCDEPHMDFRVMTLNSIVDLKVNGEDAELNEVEVSEKVVTVKGSKGADYWVTIKDGTPISCTCTGFSFRKQCRHLNEALGDVDSEPKT